MTAIAGLIGLDGRFVAESDLVGALAVLAPLGPHGTGRRVGRTGLLGTALGAVRRRRVPQDGADAQPVSVAGGRVTVVADVVLDNRAELCRLLSRPDTDDLTDAAVVAAAYLRWGTHCCERLRGAFTFAVADHRRGGVLLARDQLGIRPLHIHRGRGWLGFASTALGVTGFAGVRAVPDLDRAAEFLALLPQSRRSWLRDVAPVPPATALWITADGVRERRFWQPPEPPGPAGPARPDVAAEELRDLLDTAVQARVRHADRLGVMLSGGLDSTAVAAALARQVTPAPVRTYTSVPPPGWTGPLTGSDTGRDPDEGRLVRELAAWYPNLAPAFVTAVGESIVDGADDDLYAAGGTPARNTMNMTWVRAIHRRAAADGVDVLFTGSMGNLTFSAEDRRWLLRLLAAGRGVRAWREARDHATARGCSLAGTVRAATLGELRRCVGRRRVPPAVTALRPELLAGARWPATTAIHLVRGESAELEAALTARSGCRYADPTEDLHLVEWCARQPPGTWRNREPARTAMAGRVPDGIRLRHRRGAQLPDWFDRLDDARDEIRRELSAATSHPASRHLLDLDRLDALVAHWPPAADHAPVAGYRLALPRALAVSRYLRWLDGWDTVRPRAGHASQPPVRSRQ